MIQILENNLAAIGLVLDLIGFWIIAWDVLPTYRLETKVRDIKRCIGKLDGLMNKSSYDENDIEYLKDIVAFMKNHKVDYGRWYQIERRLRGKNTKTFSNQFLDDITNVLNKNMEALFQKIDARRRSLVRPPILLGVALVSIGFIFQFLGSLKIS